MLALETVFQKAVTQVQLFLSPVDNSDFGVLLCPPKYRTSLQNTYNKFPFVPVAKSPYMYSMYILQTVPFSYISVKVPQVT